MKAEELKARLRDVVPGWVGNRVDALLRATPQINPVAAQYLRKGITNAAERQAGRIGELVDKVFMFIGDKDGEVDISTLLDDLVSMVKGCKETALLDSGLLSVKAGGGNILKVETRNPFVTFLTGGTTALRVDEEDVRELKALLLA